MRERLLLYLQNPGTFGRILWMATLVRLGILFLSDRLNSTEYWEYGHLAQSLLFGRGFQFPFVDEQLNFLDSWYPSALMPPGYVLFLTPFFLIQQVVWRNLLLFSIQIGLSVLALWQLHGLVKKKMNLSAANLSVLILALLPDMIFAPLTVGPTVWFHLLMVLFLGMASRLTTDYQRISLIFIAALLVYFRSEVLLFVGLFTLWLTLKGDKKLAFGLVLGVGIFLFPWVWRNHQVLGTWSISNNLGVNFYRGNNPGEIGDWPPQMAAEVVAFRQHPANYERNFDQWALQQSWNWIMQNPRTAILRLPEKLFRFWVLDWKDARSLSPLMWVPWLPILCLGIIGFWQCRGKGMEAWWLLLLAYTLVMLVFFPQLRYQTMIRFFFIPFSAWGLLGWLANYFKDQKP